METVKGNTRLHCVANLLWKRLWTCRKTGYGMNEGASALCPNRFTHVKRRYDMHLKKWRTVKYIVGVCVPQDEYIITS